MKLLGGFPLVTYLAGRGSFKDVFFHIEARQIYSDLSLNLIQSLKLFLGGSQDRSASFFGPGGLQQN